MTILAIGMYIETAWLIIHNQWITLNNYRTLCDRSLKTKAQWNNIINTIIYYIKSGQYIQKYQAQLYTCWQVNKSERKIFVYLTMRTELRELFCLKHSVQSSNGLSISITINRYTPSNKSCIQPFDLVIYNHI